MELSFINDYLKEYDEYEVIYEKITDKTFKMLNISMNYIIEVNLIDNEKIHELNKEYRSIDRPTDVISFAFLDEIKGEIKISGDIPILLGEIFISVERALSQAKEIGHSIKREMSFLFIHGLLHLLGYNHETIEDEEKMFALQENILWEE